MAHARKLPLALILLAISALAAEHRGKVEFGGLPVPGVTVTATRGDQIFTAVTDPQGAYVFPDLPEGTWKFHIEMLGFAVIDRDVTVAPGAPADAWDLQMLPIGAMNATAASPPATPSPAAQTAGATSAAQTTGTTPATAPLRSRLRSVAHLTSGLISTVLLCQSTVTVVPSAKVVRSLCRSGSRNS
jgi:Carboxypeptidase regulatory-like domain